VTDFTALGDTVNTAARLQGEARAGQIAVSDDLYSAFAGHFPQAVQRGVHLKGKEDPTTYWISGTGVRV
jgi:adenylate cyclase